MIMTIGEDPHGRRHIRLVGIEFDTDEELASASFVVTLSAHIEITGVLGVSDACGSYSGLGVAVVLNVPQIRTLVEHFADPRTPKTPEADAIFNRMIAILGTFREDLL